jgi:3-methylcrotonyl-CoA carboxylase alpha subunit
VPKETITIRVGDQEVQAARVEETSGLVNVTFGDGEPLLVRAIGSDAYRVTRGDRTWRAIAVEDGHRRWVFVDGQVAVVEVHAKSVERTHKRSGPQPLTAPMPATVIKIMVTANQSVKKGETLLLLEAMKMELPIRAPADGVVKKLHCKEGELVQPDTLLIDFE